MTMQDIDPPVGVDFVALAESLCCRVLTGAAATWPTQATGGFEDTLLSVATAHGVDLMLAYALARHPDALTWPKPLQRLLKNRLYAYASAEILLDRELQVVFEALAGAGIRPLLMKGGALAHSHYPASCCRPRCDADLLFDAGHIAPAMQTLSQLGYRFPAVPQGKWVRTELTATRDLLPKVRMELDVHWKIYNRPPLRDALGYTEAFRLARPLPALGEQALALCPIHGLLFACIHRATNLRDPLRLCGQTLRQGNRLIWLYDIHLLLLTMPIDECLDFAKLAQERGCLAICRDAIAHAEARFATPLHAALRAALADAKDDEPSSVYLALQGQSQLRNLLAEYRMLPDFGSRLRLLGEQLFPPAAYMLERYPWANPLLLPCLYPWRLLAELPRLLRR